MFTTVLIANRGEIALRVARTCRELGLRTVAVYSSADRDSAVVRFADEAVHIGPATPRRSYNHIPAIIEAALRTGAEAIHPGYGFLSEDPDFAEVCTANGLTFIGPRPEVMSQLGDKARARKIMAAAGLPVLPGTTEPVASVSEAKEVADAIGYPVIIKAAAGGGGRGMRVARGPGDFVTAYKTTKADAQIIFGDGRVYLERYLDSARHVEVQVLADRHGNTIHLGERDCSVQRRHQKLIEETPAPDLPAGLAEQMGELAVRGAKAVGYEGAGTFEFLVDPAGTCYFMEINCRIQVEHPVTELVTGVDLVREQILVAAGHPLGLRQEDVVPRGAAIECRINAEDPDRDFAPAPGRITELRLPGGPFTRVDTHVYQGYKVSADYDSLLAKQLVWAPNREQAIARMDRALSELELNGPGLRTTRRFLSDVLSHPLFVKGRHSTSLVDQMREEERG